MFALTNKDFRNNTKSTVGETLYFDHPLPHSIQTTWSSITCTFISLACIRTIIIITVCFFFRVKTMATMS